MILAIYLKQIGFDELFIGFILSATLVNSIIFNLFSSFFADRIGRKKVLIIYASLMTVSGCVFLLTENYFALIITAFIGTINVTGSETGAFLSLEQAILPQTVKSIKKTNSVFALYNMIGTFAMAGGVLLASLPQILQENFGYSTIDSFKPLFLIYLLAGIAVVVIYFFFSKEIEVKKSLDSKTFSTNLSPKSKQIILKLSSLFALDSFAGGFVIQSIVAFWFFTKFGVDLTTLSLIFSVAGVLTAISFYFAAKIADRIGLIYTMVFTHIPSNILLILVAIAPTFHMALGLYLARMSLSQMDVPTRQAYIVAVVEENERTAAAGITNTSRNIAQSISPSITGAIIQSLWLSAPFVIGGMLKIVYDIGIFINFRKIKPSFEID
ncbi:Permeases of the major facilitator superfamily [Candidatus Nitrosarchaeum limnium SFB1]|uniref:Permeases of the major facilitator superfamily n=1 Tax=Candidatus Nitrosarchaeum limnium SFB1 TaxID=886738 RepID=F3KHT8_9ARCH|nr:Permeases of the major facilitator superfamily [Candidatus Nitrosarchaeum limnium SFB1]